MGTALESLRQHYGLSPQPFAELLKALGLLMGQSPMRRPDAGVVPEITEESGRQELPLGRSSWDTNSDIERERVKVS